MNVPKKSICVDIIYIILAALFAGAAAYLIIRGMVITPLDYCLVVTLFVLFIMNVIQGISFYGWWVTDEKNNFVCACSSCRGVISHIDANKYAYCPFCGLEIGGVVQSNTQDEKSGGTYGS